MAALSSTANCCKNCAIPSVFFFGYMCSLYKRVLDDVQLCSTCQDAVSKRIKEARLVPILPADIWKMIVLHLDDEKTLAALRLTSLSFCKLATEHYFRCKRYYICDKSYVKSPYFHPEHITKVKVDDMVVLFSLLMMHAQIVDVSFGDSYNDPFDLGDAYGSIMTRLSFGYAFNSTIITVPTSVTRLEMGDCFDRPLALPSEVSHLIMGANFNSSIYVSRNSKLVYVEFGNRFNQQICITRSIETVLLGKSFYSNIIIPEGARLRRIRLPTRFRRRHDMLIMIREKCSEGIEIEYI